MKFDTVRQLERASRVVERVARDGPPAWSTIVARTFDADLDDLWDAVTSAERLPRWFMPIEGDLRLGGRYHLIGNASGTITTCERRVHLALTWEYQGISWVDVRLAATADGARLELAHLAHVPDEFWSTYGPGAGGVGWELALLTLDRHLTTGETVDPEAAQAWTTGSEEGRAFVAASSRAWAEAAVRTGTPEADALAAAARTTAFYTGG